MVETDWRLILTMSQKELSKTEKEKLCESLSWMEADDIELNFSDLKNLFRISQDILKFKNEQVNNLLGKIEVMHRKTSRKKLSKSEPADSPTGSSDTILQTITHQEEVIRANKEIIQQLYQDISELEENKAKIETEQHLDTKEKDSDSSRDPLSEMSAVDQLENELISKNRHIRKLLSDIKATEEENEQLRNKISTLNDKLSDATQIIEKLTKQIFTIDSQSSKLKESFGKLQESRSQLLMEIDTLKQQLAEGDANKDTVLNELRNKVKHWKNIVRSKKEEYEALTNENLILKDSLKYKKDPDLSATGVDQNQQKQIQLLQDKLSDASNEIIRSAELINLLKNENKNLKTIDKDITDYSSGTVFENVNCNEESVKILKNMIRNLEKDLQTAEEQIILRDKEVFEVRSEINLLKSGEEGITTLINEIKSKKGQLKLKDLKIQSFIKEINTLNQILDTLQLENETLRQNLNISPKTTVSVRGILSKYKTIENNAKETKRKLLQLENNYIHLEMNKRKSDTIINKFKNKLLSMGCKEDTINVIMNESDYVDYQGGGDGFHVHPSICDLNASENISLKKGEMQELAEENEGLRRGLQEILDFLKENSGSPSFNCPSLDAILTCMEARHSSGWFAPHMSAVLELRTAIGGRDALQNALQNARKETFEVMTQLKEESQKSIKLEERLRKMESEQDLVENGNGKVDNKPFKCEMFGNWMIENDINIINFTDKSDIKNLIVDINVGYESQLKCGLEYFHTKFKNLYHKMTEIAMQAADDQNKWTIQEEHYKAEIEKLKNDLCQFQDEDNSDRSPGIIENLYDSNSLQRKCAYLEESYKFIRTLNENIKNEHLDLKKETMSLVSDYENKIQTLVLRVAALMDKLRNSISLDLFLNQNEMLRDINAKYRVILQCKALRELEYKNLHKKLLEDRLELINLFRSERKHIECKDNTKSVNYFEQSILQKQLETVCLALDEGNIKLQALEQRNVEMQMTFNKVVDCNLSSISKEEYDLIKDHLSQLKHENKHLKDQCKHVSNQLDIALLQLQDQQHKQMTNDMEINMLRHQILDLQSTGDNKAIIARLSGEILVSHIQASDSHKKIEKLHAALNREKTNSAEAEEMLKVREKIFDVYASRYESKFRYINEVMTILKYQYHGSLPITSLENYVNTIEELDRNNKAVEEKLNEVEDLRALLIIKHNVFDEILKINKTECLVDEEKCPHYLQKTINDNIHSRELSHCNKKISAIEQSRREIINRCNFLEKSLILINQSFNNLPNNMIMEEKHSSCDEIPDLELEDINSDEEHVSRRSQTITLPNPQILQPHKSGTNIARKLEQVNAYSVQPEPSYFNKEVSTNHIAIQTDNNNPSYDHKYTQTDANKQFEKMTVDLKNAKKDNAIKCEELGRAVALAKEKTDKIMDLESRKIDLENEIKKLEDCNSKKEHLNAVLQNTVASLNSQLSALQKAENIQSPIDNKKNWLHSFKELEKEKNGVIEDYKKLLKTERDEYSNKMMESQKKIMELQIQLNRRSSDVIDTEDIKEIVAKYTVKIVELEDRNFKIQSELDSYKSENMTYQSELLRWKQLAGERLNKMEQLNSQLQKRHFDELESYKAENQHWLNQLDDSQREQTDLKSKLVQQKTIHGKQTADKDAQIEHMRTVINGLKTQVLNLQTLLSVNDPSFDLSAIIEVDESSDVLSQQDSDRLEIKYDSTIDLHDFQDDAISRVPATSTVIWQEPLIDRLRREKQMIGKQNTILRRQIKALAGRERRARLEAQNLKNQVYRISSSGSKAATAESTVLHSKIAGLQAQLAASRRDTQSSVALWDKWKRAQQAAERWQARFEEKCQEIKKLEASFNFAKSGLTRLEREKRVLLAKFTERSQFEDKDVAFGKQEDPEKALFDAQEREDHHSSLVSKISVKTLMDRVEAQQRRIVALELSEKGPEPLVTEYEKALAEITALKGQVLKLESSILECQIRSPMMTSPDPHPELEYWKSYCDMLKEENMQLALKLSKAEVAPATPHQQRVNDLEQTVLTLRGLVSKLQSEQKSSTQRREGSRPSSERSVTDKTKAQLDTYRTEIANLKKTLCDKDLLLERSKEMLKIAAEREEDLLRENAYLRHCLRETTKSKGGFLSA